MEQEAEVLVVGGITEGILLVLFQDSVKVQNKAVAM